jgi:hypothetical protein
MIYMITLGLIALLSLKVAIGSTLRLASENGGPLVKDALLAVVAYTVLSWNLALIAGLFLFQAPN